ncbi:M3 family metallopeptidase [Reichenbachiella sp.]|uniref:M3 family metallopeptidase n=1 Tax=Reichenbachiella sp. TaxID=2184521 RepID=UPI003B5BE3DE
MNRWISDWSELTDTISEDFCWRYIACSKSTDDKDVRARYDYAVEFLSPRILPYENNLSQKLIDCPLSQKLNQRVFAKHLRETKRKLSLPVSEGGFVREAINQQTMMYHEAIHHLPPLHTTQDVSKNSSETIQKIMSNLVKLRHFEAVSGGFDDYISLRYAQLDRVAYDVDDCKRYHASIKRYIAPLWKKIISKNPLYATIPPASVADRIYTSVQWDNPTGEVLMSIVGDCLDSIDPEFGNVFSHVVDTGNIDIEHRLHKHKGAFVIDLPISGTPYVIMNRCHSFKDVVTLIHEAGHAIHNRYTKGAPVRFLRHFPTEVSELVALTMELMSSQLWHDIPGLKGYGMAAKQAHYFQIVHSMLWVSAIDEFQHWVYANPFHDIDERKGVWSQIYGAYFGSAKKAGSRAVSRICMATAVPHI